MNEKKREALDKAATEAGVEVRGGKGGKEGEKGVNKKKREALNKAAAEAGVEVRGEGKEGEKGKEGMEID